MTIDDLRKQYGGRWYLPNTVVAGKKTEKMIMIVDFKKVDHRWKGKGLDNNLYELSDLSERWHRESANPEAKNQFNPYSIPSEDIPQDTKITETPKETKTSETTFEVEADMTQKDVKYQVSTNLTEAQQCIDNAIRVSSQKTNKKCTINLSVEVDVDFDLDKIENLAKNLDILPEYYEIASKRILEANENMEKLLEKSLLEFFRQDAKPHTSEFGV